MAGSKSARSGGRAGTASGKSNRSAASSSRNGDRTQASSTATAARAPARGSSAGRGGSGAAGRDVRDRTRDQRDRDRRGRPAAEELAPATPATSVPPLWLQITTLVLALGGLGVSIYETYAHFNGSHLAGCTGTGGESCTKVITSPQSMVFGVIPVAVLGLVFYVFVVAIMTPWAWRMARPEVAWLRLASMVTGIGFVVYLIYAELFQIGSICLYCTSVHVITFLLFALTIFAAAMWGIGAKKAA